MAFGSKLSWATAAESLACKLHHTLVSIPPPGLKSSLHCMASTFRAVHRLGMGDCQGWHPNCNWVADMSVQFLELLSASATCVDYRGPVESARSVALPLRQNQFYTDSSYHAAVALFLLWHAHIDDVQRSEWMSYMSNSVHKADLYIWLKRLETRSQNILPLLLGWADGRREPWPRSDVDRGAFRFFSELARWVIDWKNTGTSWFFQSILILLSWLLWRRGVTFTMIVHAEEACIHIKAWNSVFWHRNRGSRHVITTETI